MDWRYFRGILKILIKEHLSR